jgi:hypothetical protein
MTYYEIYTRKKHLNGRSSLIKHNMIMNYTLLDSSFQCAQVSIAALAESSISGGTSVSLLEEIFENYS